MNLETVRAAITPLRMIFWGGMLCIFDVTFSHTVNGEGFKFDILNDAAGCLLIAFAVQYLAGCAAEVHERYARVMGFVQVMAWLSVLDAIREHFIVRYPPPLQMLLLVFGLTTLVAIIAFCVAMRWFCEAAELRESARSWSTTTALFVVIYLAPLGLFYLAALGAIVTGQSFHIDLGAGALLLLPVFAIPLVHLFMSTSRMQRAAERAQALGEGRAVR